MGNKISSGGVVQGKLLAYLPKRRLLLLRPARNESLSKITYTDCLRLRSPVAVTRPMLLLAQRGALTRRDMLDDAAK